MPRSIGARNAFVQILGETRDRCGSSLVGYVVMGGLIRIDPVHRDAATLKQKTRPSKGERVCHPKIQNRLKGCATRRETLRFQTPADKLQASVASPP
jgi:hypothetical protein